MRIKKVQLKEFKRFDDLTIDLGENPQKIVALVGPNGCGKSSIFDAFENISRNYRPRLSMGTENNEFYSKAFFYIDLEKRKSTYDKNQSIFITPHNGKLDQKSFYIRTSYRFTSKFNIQSIEAMPKIFDSKDEPISTISLDSRLVSNYKRLIGSAYSMFFEGNITGEDVRKDLIGHINLILKNILDIEISNIGNILEQKGQLYFKKGNVTDFPYANLSSGEKEVIDIIIDLIIKTKEYNDTVYCIDEPELHINTAIQRKMLIEIEKLIPDNCQLWIATHSIGFLRALQEELREKSQILDFSDNDYFTNGKIIKPIKSTRQNWQRIFSTALEDLTGMISPKRIIYCEGKYQPSSNGEEQGFDAKVFNNIFNEKYPDTFFISSGGNTELDQRSGVAISILTKVFTDVEILVLKDRDISSGRLNCESDRQIYLESNLNHHRVLKRWEIENYLFDKEVLKSYCEQKKLMFDEEEYDQFVLNIFDQNLKDSTGRIKNICGITTSINAETFKIKLSEFIFTDMNIYKELEECIFERK